MSSSETDFSLGDSDFDDDFEVKKPKSSTAKTTKPTTKPSAKSPAKNNKRKADTAPSSASKSLKTSVSSSKSISRPVAPATLPSASLVAEPVSSEASARKLILSYMRTQNRPYSVIQVFDNLHKRVGKALVQKILDALSEPSGPLKCKEYGKAKIYYLDQNQLDDVTSPEEMQRITDVCDELNERYVALQQQLHAVDVELKALVDAPPDNELDSLLADMETKCSELQQRTQHITSSTVTPKQRNDIVTSYNFYRDAWRSRKNKAMEIVEMLADGMEKKTKDVLALIGLETDEDEGVSLPTPVKG